MTKEVRTPRASVIVDGNVLTVPIGKDASEALSLWLSHFTEEIAVVLAPFGLHPYDIAAPAYERVVYREEVMGE